MKPSLQFKLSQHLALTPQLQQSIRLLQLSTLELNQELEVALQENPLLERVDDPLDHALRIAADGSLQSGTASSGEALAGTRGANPDDPSDAGSREWADDGDTGPISRQASDDSSGNAPADADSPNDSSDNRSAEDWDRDGFSDLSARARADGDEDEPGRPQLAASGGSLRDHLVTQLHSLPCGPIDRALVTLLIDELDGDGYLRTELDEVVSLLPDELDIEPEAVSAALRLLQSFDPCGVGARSVSECLMLQLSDPATAPDAPGDIRALALETARSHLPLLAARDFSRLKRSLHCTDDALRAVQELIRSLNPKPGAAFSSDAPTYVVPDVLVRQVRGQWQASLNPEVLPKLRINDLYAQILRRNRGAHPNLSGQLQEARWLIKNVQQRFDTILRVSQAIVERQRAYFSHGAVAMRPLVLREIAEAVGLHESTVSRVTTQKYMLTPFGTVELKYFFGSHVATDTGGAASSTAIRELIKQLIQSEDSRNPLSDSQIAELLGQQGIMVARRTVAKYREGLRIPAVAQRKSL